ncbi:hypothetical protein OIU76_022750 [Salix suchowensis]|nr:hypothetical protein OIU76_022750 [Salix suchowensis]
MGFDREGFRVKRNNVYAVVVFFNEAAQGNALVLVCARWGRRDCHGIERVWRFIGYWVSSGFEDGVCEFSRNVGEKGKIQQFTSSTEPNFGANDVGEGSRDFLPN